MSSQVLEALQTLYSDFPFRSPKTLAPTYDIQDAHPRRIWRIHSPSGLITYNRLINAVSNSHLASNRQLSNAKQNEEDVEGTGRGPKWCKIPAFVRRTEKIHEESQNSRSETETQTVGSLMQGNGVKVRASFLELAVLKSFVLIDIVSGHT